MRHLFVSLLLLTLIGCELDYEGAIMVDEISEDIPDTVLIEFTHSLIRNGSKSLVIQSSRGEFYEKKKQTDFFEVNFFEYDSEGLVVTSGACDHARLYTDTEDVELWGGLEIFSAKDEAHLLGETLFWNDADGILSSPEDEVVSISQDSGTSFSGKGFTAETRSRTVKYSSHVEGYWIGEDE